MNTYKIAKGVMAIEELLKNALEKCESIQNELDPYSRSRYLSWAESKIDLLSVQLADCSDFAEAISGKLLHWSEESSID
jgi:hypothetical protein